jgi:integrase
VRLYDLRHTHATLLSLAGVHPKVVSERLGHANITITLETYSHVLPNMQAEALSKLEGLMAEPTEVVAITKQIENILN